MSESRTADRVLLERIPTRSLLGVMLISWASACVLLATSMSLGCSRDERAAKCAEDRTALLAVISADQRVVGLLREVDDLALKGKPLEAAVRIEKGARTAMDQVVVDTNDLVPRTKWGQARKGDLVELTSRRRELLDTYVTALRSEELGTVIGELEQQRDLEKRALEVQRGVSTIPDVSTGSCDPP